MRPAILLASVVACGTPTTSLHGTTSCTDTVGTTITCPDGQLCIEGRGEPDDGSIPPMCTAVASCELHDCIGAGCPACVLKLCPYYPSYIDGTHLDGRILHCP